MKTLFHSILVVLLFAYALFAQDVSINSMLSEGKQTIEHGYNQFDKAQLLKAHSIFERVLSAQPDNKLALYYLTYSEYRIISYAINKPDKTLFENFIDKAVDDAKKLNETTQYKSEGSTVLAAIYMMKIARNQSEAIALTPLLHGLLDEAQAVDSTNPRSYLIRGIMKYNTPEFFGGSKEDAVKNFNHSISLYIKSTVNDSLKIGWGFDEAYTWLGIALKDKNKTAEARDAFNKALEIAPDNAWVKYRLLPGLDKAEASTK